MKMSENGFGEFCGNSSIFNFSLLLDNSWPQFTECFQNSLLVWVPCGWLWITLPLYAIYLKSLTHVAPTPINSFNSVKTFGSFLLALLTVMQMGWTTSKSYKSDLPKGAPVVFVSGAIKFVTFILAGILIQLERRKGIVTSGILWIFWFLLFVAGIIPFYSKIIQENFKTDLFQFSLFYVYFALVVSELVLHSFAEQLTRQGYQILGENPSPEVTASFPSRLIFTWLDRVVLQAYRKGLVESDLFDLHPRDKSSKIWPVFQKAWEKELQRAKDKIKELELRRALKDKPVHIISYTQKPFFKYSGRYDNDSETTAILNGSAATINKESKTTDKKKEGAEGSLIKALAKTFGYDLVVSWCLKTVYDLLQFVSPQLLDLLIGYTNNKAQEPQWKGYVYACSFFVVAVAGSVFFHQQFHVGMTLGMRIGSACMSAVYKKALTMTNEARKESTVGEIVNLMSVDCQRIRDVTGYLWMVWSAPLQVALALALLWGQLGASVLAGVAIMILLIPLNACIAFKTRQYQMKQMTFKDARLKLMNEVLSGMKVLKLYAWEQSFEDKVNVIRNKELVVLKKAAYLNAFSTFTWTCAPFVVTLATFATYVLVSEANHLDAQKAFVSLSLFNILRSPINLLPMIIAAIAQAQVSVVRLSKFLSYEELDTSNVVRDPNAAAAIKISKGIFTWDKAQPLSTLRKINLEIPKGKLVAVVGQVGSGKSSLVSAILGEMEKVNGQVVVQSSIAYVPQQAWIQNDTLRDNILFGKDYNAQLYDKVVDACALRADLDILPGGDFTEIGEKGINLSGGQKQRVSLARAVYNDADIYLLDDPLSAVDSHVGKHIFHNVVGAKGMLKDKTRVLVTHGVHWLPMVDTIVVMRDGIISEMGSYDQLLSHDGDFAQFLKQYLTQNDDDEDEDPEILEIKAKILERVDSVTSDTGASSADEIRQHNKRLRTRSRAGSKRSMTESLKSMDKSAKEGHVTVKDKSRQKLIVEEKAEIGKVKWAVFITYFRALGICSSIGILVLFAFYQGLSIYSSIWLSEWTDDKLLANVTLSNTTAYENRNYIYLGVYGALGAGQGLFVLAYSYLASTTMVNAAGSLHAAMLSKVMRSPMSFFDTTPSGRIINRFSSDVNIADNTLPQTIRQVLLQAFSALSMLIVISYSTPIFLVIMVPLAVLYYLVQCFYIPTSRQLKRIESTTRSPIYNHFSETINGAASVRAYGVTDRFIEENKAKVDKNLVFYFAGIASNRWLGIRLEFLGNLVVLAAAIFAVVTPDLEGGLVGLSVSYAMQVTAGLTWLVRMMSDLETNVVSVERLKEYSEMPTEAEWVLPGQRPPPEWPSEGSVDFVSYSTRYRDGLDLVLKDVSCHIEGGEKVGIVGRTGAGKSSMTVALFRLIESAAGSIVIDHHTIANMGLHDLRSRITILPQDPVLFSGTLRMNLDPFDQYTDQLIWTALDHAHLKKFVSDTPTQLMYECGEGGANLSVGQRQLVCLARSLLRKTKILVLDEATAAVDMETDDLIQQTIRSEFKDCTVITIAHRLNTIMDYDRLVVMDQGRITEHDTPSSLLQNKHSVFYGMAKDANLV